jgi:hypothetical protein
MKILRAEKFQPKKRDRTTPKKPPTVLRKTDWEALMQHDPSTGKLDLKSQSVLIDPSSVKRLLEAEMIDPDGKLTPEARKKCAVLSQILQNPVSPSSATPELPGEVKPAEPALKKIEEMTASDWAVLMKYDRQTGNLLKVDPDSGQLDNTSRAVLKDASIIQRLIDHNLILPGGWLTTEAKEECARIEKKLKAQSAGGNSGLKGNPGLKDHPGSKYHPEQLSKGSPERESREDQKPKMNPAPKPKNAKDLQAFFENLPNDAPDSGPASAMYFVHGSEDLQVFFENLPHDVPDSGPESGIYPESMWLDSKDLQAFFENLPHDDSDPGSGDARPSKEGRR